MTESPTDSIPIFYACIPEAPKGPPIEIAWATLAFETHGVTCANGML